MDCLFCEIVKGERPAHVVLDDGPVVAFLDTRPLFKGHTLLVPRTHVETLADLPADLLQPLFAAGQQLSVAMETALAAAGSFVAVNNRISQSVPHLHVHVVPRNRKDGLRGFFWPRTKYDSDDEARAYADRIRGALG
ncbi:HIT family protein [Actinoallomurus purpureus]|jgi:histidine triad (HIT) family protein|uniref:HIT family protein n=1 Tax=Actinoallomurus purpureus TaxID=478114 RepID=UPI0027E2DD4B|nr:HIT family protein [Actinoallomurus purpureus]